MSVSTILIITASDILLLVSIFCHDNLFQWREMGQLEQLLEQGSGIAITDCSFNGLVERGRGFGCFGSSSAPAPRSCGPCGSS